jgi:hypothetical protein
MTLCLPQTPPLPTHFPSSNILLWPSCALGSPGLPHRQQAGLAVGVAENLFCRVHSVCTVHTAVYNPPHTIQSLRMHPCTAVAESSTTPTQCCAMTAKQPSPAAPHTVAHSRPSPCTRIHTHVSRTPDVASRPYIAQVMPASRRSQYCNKPVSEIHLLYTRVPPCPRKSSCPKYVQSYRHPFAAATPWPVPCP